MEWGVGTCVDAGAAKGVVDVAVDHPFPHPSVGGGK
jgi:hypothetical protein